MKRSALVGVKLAVSAALLAYLFSSTDTRALEQRVRSADLLMLVAAVFCYIAMLALATWRWRILLHAIGVDVPATGDVIPNYLVMAGLIVLLWTIVAAMLVWLLFRGK